MAEQRIFLNRAAIAPREARSTADMYFGDRPGSPGSDIYYKGSWVLHTLRWLMGDEQFIPMLRRMAYPVPELEKTTDGSACRFATTEEIIAIAEELARQDLGWFFDVYLRQPALPVLDWRVEDGVLLLAWDSPTGEPFPLPVEVVVAGRALRVECPGGEGRLDLRGNTEFQVDPNDRVLRGERER
jgi:aminopeptidase N